MKEEHKRRQANPFTGEGGAEKRWGWADEVKPGEPARAWRRAVVLGLRRGVLTLRTDVGYVWFDCFR